MFRRLRRLFVEQWVRLVNSEARLLKLLDPPGNLLSLTPQEGGFRNLDSQGVMRKSNERQVPEAKYFQPETLPLAVCRSATARSLTCCNIRFGQTSQLLRTPDEAYNEGNKDKPRSSPSAALVPRDEVRQCMLA